VILNKEKLKEFAEITEPIIAWMNSNLHPHNSIIINTDRAELLESSCLHITEKHIVD
jgi:hypothetical protein